MITMMMIMMMMMMLIGGGRSRFRICTSPGFWIRGSSSRVATAGSVGGRYAAVLLSRGGTLA